MDVSAITRWRAKHKTFKVTFAHERRTAEEAVSSHPVVDLFAVPPPPAGVLHAETASPDIC